MPDYLFGVEIPEYPPQGVFPYDPDFNFKRGRKWNTVIHRFSPLLEQRFVRSASPLTTFSIGFDAMKSQSFWSSSKFRTLWEFFEAHRGAGIPFYFYDPVPWSYYPYSENWSTNYRDNPEARLYAPDPTLGRFICFFADDEMSVEMFEAKLRRTQLNLEGYPG